MNRLEKKSFYSFLLLYLISSTLFLSLSAFWYYDSAKISLKSMNYYKMQHIADKYSSLVINAHMMGINLELPTKNDSYKIGLFDKNRKKIYGDMELEGLDFDKDFYSFHKSNILISMGSRDHLGISYVVVSSDEFYDKFEVLKQKIIFIFIFALLIVAIIGWILSRIFLRPIRKKIDQIETFIKDMSHELNTPITALMMSASRIKAKKVYDEKILRNISISTKQLYEMYTALTYINFSPTKRDEQLDFKDTVNQSCEYFEELLQSKKITIQKDIKSNILNIDKTKASMLINNLLSNAIKYSHPNSQITVLLDENSLVVQDQGIGIAKEKLKNVFKIYQRASSYAGGFGVGLSVVKSICDEYEFEIAVDSKEDKGTKIEILFKKSTIKMIGIK